MDLDLKKLPKFAYVVAIVLFVAILYWIFIGRSLIENAPIMMKEHEDNVALINKYDNVLSQEKVIEDEIKKNTQEYEKKQKELFIDLDSCSKEIEKYCKDKNIKLKNYSISEPQVDKKGRVSSAGYPVYTVNINLSYSDTYDKTLEFIKYVEKASKGCYNVKNVTFTESKDNKNQGDASISMTLYYYDTTAAPKVQKATQPATGK